MTVKLARSSSLSGLIKRRVDDIIKSPEDKRLYRGYELANNMKVMLISDPETDKSAAGLDISIGSINNPKEIPGLAHYCEHMIFMGTEKYPVENDYDNYLSLHGGFGNAYTSNDHTNYHFEVGCDAIEGAIDRFAQFFIAPVFNKNSSEREVMAVDSEFRNILQNDDGRLEHLGRCLSQETHPYFRFDCGNKFSLWENPTVQYNLDPHHELLKFYKANYSANLMRLCVLARESLDDLEEMVIPLFAKVVDKEVQRPISLSHPYGPEQIKRKVSFVPVQDLRRLYLQFPTPDLRSYHKSKPGFYISHLLHHEGSTGILAELRRLGWAKEVNTEYDSPSIGFGFFNVEIELSPEGLKKVEDIVVLFFQYVRSIFGHGRKIEEWVHKEVERINEIKFLFADKTKPDDCVTYVTHNMHDYDLKDVLFSPDYAMPDFKPELIKLMLDLINPNNMLIIVIAKEFEGKTDKMEKWFGLNYSVEPLSPVLIQRCLEVQPSTKFALPNKNEFIPENFDIRSKISQGNQRFPTLTHNDPIYRCWHKQDETFLTPKLCSYIRFRNPSLFNKPADIVSVALLCDAVKDVGMNYIYDARLSGLDLSLSHNEEYGLDLKIEGFHEKHGIFLRKLLNDLICAEPDPVRFEMLKESYLRELKNFHMKEPYNQASEYLDRLLYDKAWSVNELLNELGEFSLDRLMSFRRNYFQNMHVEICMHGNASEKDSEILSSAIISELSQSVSIKPLFSSQLQRRRVHRLQDGRDYMFEALNTTHSHSCASIFLQTCLENPKTNILTELTQQILNEPFYDQLRTKEQLGYIVFCCVKKFNGVRGIYLVIQSGQNPSFVENKMESFLERMLKNIEKMSEEEFNEHKEALATERLDKPKTLSDLCEKYWTEITQEQYHFDRDNAEVEVLRAATKQELVEFYKDYISRCGAKRKKLSIHVYSASDWETRDKDGSLNKRRKNHTVLIDNVISFKASLPLYETSRPYAQIPPAGFLISEEWKCKL